MTTKQPETEATNRELNRVPTPLSCSALFIGGPKAGQRIRLPMEFLIYDCPVSKKRTATFCDSEGDGPVSVEVFEYRLIRLRGYHRHSLYAPKCASYDAVLGMLIDGYSPNTNVEDATNE